MDEKLDKVRELLKKYNQEHLLVNWNNMSDENKKVLLRQIEETDFEEVKRLYELTKHNIEKEKQDKIEPIEYQDSKEIKGEEKKKLIELGKKEILEGKLAIVTMAGGQGTRLGHEGPKGTYVVKYSEGEKSLFEILSNKLKKAKEEYGVSPRWYIMTSIQNHDDTVKFFEENNYFGYDKDAVVFFKQSELPMLGEDGKILLTEEGLMKKGANGHGGVFSSMKETGVIDDMKEKGVEWVFVSGVDNALANLVDPQMLGLAKSKEYQMVGESVIKTNPKEKVGVFCLRNGKPSVVEYSEISEEMANRRAENGGLVFGDAHVLLNMFKLSAIEKVCDEKLPYHVAHKKATYMDENGKIVEGKEPNSYKFESFIFDAFEKLENAIIYRELRENVFSPIKNKEGEDSPATAIAALNAKLRREREDGLSR